MTLGNALFALEALFKLLLDLDTRVKVAIDCYGLIFQDSRYDIVLTENSLNARQSRQISHRICSKHTLGESRTTLINLSELVFGSISIVLESSFGFCVDTLGKFEFPKQIHHLVEV